MIQGLDLLAGARYSKEVISFSGFALGIFADTFGDAFPVVEAALKKGCKLVRVQLLWSDTHQFGDKDIKKVKKLAKKYNELANKYPAADVRLSPFCEHNLGNPDKYLDIAQLAAPNCTIINTPWKGAFSKKYINEIHGDHAKPSGRYMYSVDGGYPRKDGTYDDFVDKDAEAIKAKYSDAEVFFQWHSRENLRWNTKDKASRPQRIKESKQRKPTKDFIESQIYQFNTRGKYTLPKGWTLKSHSEKHEASDRKGDKLLFIAPIKAKEITLKRNGKVIGKLPYYGTFENRYRYYSAQMGYKFGKDVEVWIGKKYYGICDCGFRNGDFR